MLELSDKAFKENIITVVKEVKKNMLVMNDKKKEISRKEIDTIKKVTKILNRKIQHLGENTWTQEQNGKYMKIDQ